jgi:hypothetical protein
MKTYDNGTKFGIHSTAGRYSWAAYHIFVLLSSVIGDTLILYASFQKSAFKLNKFLLTVIQYIAAFDLSYTAIDIFPTAASLIANAWVLGDGMCYARVYLSYFVYLVGMSLIAILTTSKCLLLKYPLSRFWTAKIAHRVCCLALISPIINPIIAVIVDKDDVLFDYRTYTCSYAFNADIWVTLLLILSPVSLFIPNIVIIVTTIPTLRYLVAARKSAERTRSTVPRQGASTVALTAIIYCISTLPALVYYIGRNFVKDQTSSFHVHLYRIAIFMSAINIMSNFYIYTLTITSFRRFILVRFLSVLPACFQKSQEIVSKD